jgi:hypothetical protein
VTVKRPTFHSPELQLWSAVLDVALIDARSLCGGPDRDQARHFLVDAAGPWRMARETILLVPDLEPTWVARLVRHAAVSWPQDSRSCPERRARGQAHAA